MDRELEKYKVHMQVAYAYANLSRAKRLKVGSVLVKDGRVLSVGFNGTPSGYDNECEEPTGEVLTSTIPQQVTRTRAQVVHAETNVIAFAAKNGVSTNGCTMFITDSPCFECAKLIIQAGISEVVYDREYRVKDGIEFLKECGVKVVEL